MIASYLKGLSRQATKGLPTVESGHHWDQNLILNFVLNHGQLTVHGKEHVEEDCIWYASTYTQLLCKNLRHYDDLHRVYYNCCHGY